MARRHRHAGDDDGGEHGVLTVPVAHPGRHRHARALRRRAAARDVPAEDGDRGVDRHDEPHRAAGGVGRRRPHHACGTGRRRHVADHRTEDLHHVRRARSRRQHRPPRPRSRSRRAARDEGDLVLHRPQVPRRRRWFDRTAQRRRVCVARGQDGHQRQSDVRDGVRGCRRVPRRRAQPGHALHVQDDEHGEAVGRHRRSGRRRPGVPAGGGVRQRTGAGSSGRRRRPTATPRSSNTPTCAGCCSR